MIEFLIGLAVGIGASIVVGIVMFSIVAEGAYQLGRADAIKETWGEGKN